MIKSIEIEGKLIRYLKEGRGEPLVLIHGLGNFMISWMQNTKNLAKRFTVHALDLPGHGYSSPLKKGEASLSFSSAFLERFFDKVGLDKFTCVGASLGGLICLRYALDYPDRVKKLVLVNSAGLGRGISWFLRVMSLPLVGEYFSRPDPKVVRRMSEKLVYHKECIPEEMVHALVHVRSIEDLRKNMLELLRYGVNMRGQKKRIIHLQELGNVTTPTLLLWGENDPVFSVEQAYRAVSLFPNAALRVFPETGHLLSLERPREFERAIIEFVLDDKGGKR